MHTPRNDTKNVANMIDPIVWSIPEKVNANCYVFALGPNRVVGGYKKRLYKARPGDKCKHFKGKEFNFSNCEDIVKRTLCDNPKFVSKVPHTTVHKDVPTNSHLMAAVLSPGPEQDFHYLRRISFEEAVSHIKYLKKHTPMNTLVELLTKQPKYIWIHQRGWSPTGPIIHDAKDKLITNPKTANLDYGRVKYSIYCGLFQVKNKSATVTTEHNY
jgi:hypothetical protein